MNLSKDSFSKLSEKDKEGIKNLLIFQKIISERNRDLKTTVDAYLKKND